MFVSFTFCELKSYRFSAVNKKRYLSSIKIKQIKNIVENTHITSLHGRVKNINIDIYVDIWIYIYIVLYCVVKDSKYTFILQFTIDGLGHSWIYIVCIINKPNITLGLMFKK